MELHGTNGESGRTSRRGRRAIWRTRLEKAGTVLLSAILVFTLSVPSALAESMSTYSADSTSAVDTEELDDEAVSEEAESTDVEAAEDESSDTDQEAASEDDDAAVEAEEEADESADAEVTGDETDPALEYEEAAAQEEIVAVESLPEYSGGSGTEDDPYLISTASDLESLREATNLYGSSGSAYYYEQTADIDLDEVQWDKGIGYVGLDSSDTTVYMAFAGSYDGGGYTISGLNIVSEEEDIDNSYIALFGYVVTSSGSGIVASVHDLTVEGTVSNASTQSSSNESPTKLTAGIVAYLSSGTVYDCTSKVDVSSTGYTGILYTKGTTYFNSTSGAITAGVVAMVSSAPSSGYAVHDCINYGSVTNDSYITGGIVGLMRPNNTISDCTNNGDVTTNGGYYTGGVLGVSAGYSNTVVNCMNTGAVTSTVTASTLSSMAALAPAIPNAIGGVVGYVWGSSFLIQACVNKGDVTSQAVSVGGVVGCLGDYTWSGTASSGSWSDVTDDATIDSCYNSGDVTTYADDENAAAAGVVAVLPTTYSGSTGVGATMTNCFSTGTVSAPNLTTGYVAGIAVPYVGALPSSATSTVSNNYFLTGTAIAAFGAEGVGNQYNVSSAGTYISSSNLQSLSTLGDLFTVDSSNTYNDGYPYLTWENPDATFAVTIVLEYSSTGNVGENSPTLVVTDSNGTAYEFTASSPDDDGTITFTASLPNGDYSYTISQPGYGQTSTSTVDDPIEGEFMVHNATVSVEEEFTAKRYKYYLTVDPADATVSSVTKVEASALASTAASIGEALEVAAAAAAGDDGADDGTDDEVQTADTAVVSKTYLLIGDYTVDVSAFGYTRQTHSFTIDYADAEGEVTLSANATHTLTMTLVATEGYEFTDDTLPVVQITAEDEDGNEYDATYTATVSEDDASVAVLVVELPEFIAADSSDSCIYSYYLTAAAFNTMTGTLDLTADCEVEIELAEKTMWDGTYDISWYDEDDPQDSYEISTAEQLAGLSYLVHQWGGSNSASYTTSHFAGVTFYLTADLDLGGSVGYEWYPIGYYKTTCYFSGTFDGQGHTITGLYVNTTNNFVGLFGGTKYATIKNLTVEGEVYGSTTAGGIVGSLVSGTIENCTADVDVYSSASSGYFGVIAGEASGDYDDEYPSYVYGCVAYGSVVTTGKSPHVGGIVGYLYNADLVQCINYAEVNSSGASTTSTSSYYLYGAGGIVGYLYTGGNVELCVNYGDVYGMNAGGIAGVSRGDISSSYNNGDIYGVNAGGSSSAAVCLGGVVGLMRKGTYTSTPIGTLTSTYSRGQITACDDGSVRIGSVIGSVESSSSWPSEGSDAVVSNYGLEGCGAEDAIGGYSLSGSNAQVAYEVEGAAEEMDDETLKSAASTIGLDYADDTSGDYNEGYPYLRWLNPNATYSLILSISYDDESNTSDEEEPVVTLVDSDGETVELSSQNGLDYTFEVSDGTYYYTVEQDGYETVEDVEVTVSGAAVQIDVELAIDLAALTFTIAPAEAKLVVSDEEGNQMEAVSSDSETGITVYELPRGTYTYTVTLYAYETVTGTLDITYYDVDMDIEMESTPTSDLTFEVSPSSTTSFSSSGATIAVYSDGLLVWYDTVAAGDDGIVTTTQSLSQGSYTYAIGATGFEKATGSFTLGEDSQTISVTLEDGVAWDGTVDYEWGYGDAYSQNDTFLIMSEEELAGFAYLVNTELQNFSGKTVILGCDLDLDDVDWTPIGNDDFSFQGTFDGGYYSIVGLNITRTDDDDGSLTFGLFGYVRNATICNVLVRGNINVTAYISSYSFAAIGGIAGRANYSDFVNCGNEVNITVVNDSETSVLDVGGIVGWGVCTDFESCYNTGGIDVSNQTSDTNGQAQVGGLVGFMNIVGYGTSIIDCYNMGNVSASSDFYLTVGGLAGTYSGYDNYGAAATIENVYNTGTITGTLTAHVDDSSSYVGAFVGSYTDNSESTVTNAHYLTGSADDSFGLDESSYSGTFDTYEETDATMIASSFVDVMNAGGSSWRSASTDSDYYPLLAWQKSAVSIELVTMPDKTEYVDGENFDGTGMTVSITFEDGDVIVIDSGWAVANGTNLKPDVEYVTISYRGVSLQIPVTVEWHDQYLPETLTFSIDAPETDAYPDTDLEASDTSTEDVMDLISYSLCWMQTGSVMTDTVFSTMTYYRTEVTLTSSYDYDGHFLFAEDTEIVVDDAYDVIDVERSDDGQTLTFTVTWSLTDKDNDEVSDSATHLYYEGDSARTVITDCLPGEDALTIVAYSGYELTVSLEDIEYLALTTYIGSEADYSTYEDDGITVDTYTGVSLYGLLQSYGVLTGGMGDSTEVTLTDSNGDEYTVTIGDIRQLNYTYDEDGEQTGSVSAQLSFARNGNPFLKELALLSTDGPLMVNLGMDSATDTSQTSFANIVKIEIGEPAGSVQYDLSFDVVDSDGNAISDWTATVTDEAGNRLSSNSDGSYSLNEYETYDYLVTKDGYIVQTGSATLEDGDETVTVLLLQYWDGETLVEPETNEDGAYLIGTAEELAWWNVNATIYDDVILTADIAMGDCYTYEPEDTDDLDRGNWTTMFSDSSGAYRGTFDGNGHTIYGLYIYRENEYDLWIQSGAAMLISDRVDCVGFFGYTYGATIKDLGIVGEIYVVDRPDSSSADWLHCGGIVGLAQGSTTISGCYVNVGITVEQATGGGYLTDDDGNSYSLDGNPDVCDQYIGGIAGAINVGCTISDCYSTGAYVGQGTRSVSVGGIAGATRGVSSGSSTIENCYSTALVGGTPLDSTSTTTIKSCFGGIVGKPLAAAGYGMVPSGYGVTESAYADSLAVEGEENIVCTIEELEYYANEGEVATSAVTSCYIEGCYALNSVINGKLDEDSSSDRSLAGRICGLDVATTSDNYALATMSILNATTYDTETADGIDITNVDSRLESTYTGNGWSTDMWWFPDDSTPLLWWQTELGIMESITDNFAAVPESSSSGYDFTVSFQVTGHSAIEVKTYTLDEMETLAGTDSKDGTKYYSSYSYYGAAGRVVVQYVYFDTILEDTGLVFESGDIWKMGMYYDYDTYFGKTRYYFPYWDTYSSANKVEIEPVIAIKSYGGSSGMSEDMLKLYASSADNLWTYVLNFGQTSPTEMTYGYFIYQQSAGTIIYDADDEANETVTSYLEELIAAATEDLDSTKSAESASEVSYGADWVTSEIYEELRDELAAAKAALAESGATNDSLMDAYETLKSALDDFDAAKKTGTYLVGLTDFEAMVEVAILDLTYTIVDTDGSNTPTSETWVTADAQAALLEIVREAQQILSASGSISDEDLSAAADALEAALDEFDGSKKFGSSKDTDDVIRRAGSTRYGTAVAISQTAYPLGTDTVVIATGENFPDALAGSALAGILDAPILLSSSTKGLTDEVLEEIERLGATNVVILGGTGAVPEKVVSQLESIGISSSNIERVSGSTRIETALEIYEYGEGQWGSTAIITSSQKYADALSIGGYSASSASPIFLANTDGTVSDDVLEAIAEGGFERVLILGGSSAVSEDAESLVELAGIDSENIIRLYGSNRYETNEAVNEWLLSDESGSGFDASTPAFAVGGKKSGTSGKDNKFADALTGSVLQGLNGSILVLVNPNDESNGLDAISDLAEEVDVAYIFGGTSAVSQDFAQKLSAMLNE